MKKKNEIISTLKFDEILNDIVREESIDFFGHCSVTTNVKNGKFIAIIDNMKSDINICIDMNDIAHKYGFRNWRVCDLCQTSYDDTGTINLDCEKTEVILLFNKI